jgi:hypothetical protein
MPHATRASPGDRTAFVDDVLDRYAASGAGDGTAPTTFRFYQMDVTLVPDARRVT